MVQPFELTVTQAASEIRADRLSPVELLQSLLDRIDALEPSLQAWATLVPEQALEAARRAEQEMRSYGPRSVMHGIPFGAKDIFDTAGIRTAAGSKIWADRVPDADAASVAYLKSAGGVLLGKTHTTEFADGDPAPSRNPWNAAHTAGGSSTGSGVAVAARMVPAAFGSQTVGSVLRPASYNGVVGLKPTFGRISRRGVIPMAFSFDHVGLLVRSVEDAAALLGLLAGRDDEDPESSHEPVGDYLAALVQPPTTARFGLVRTWFSAESDAETRLRTEEVAQELAKAGAEVVEVDPGIDFGLAYEQHRVMQEAEMAQWHEPLYTGNEHLYGPKISVYLQNGLSHLATRYVAAAAYRREVQRLAKATLENVDVLLMPTTSAPAPADLTQTGDTRFQSPWSYIGFPSISIPMGLAGNGMPLGLQMVCGPFDEAKLLSVARWAEQALGIELNPPV